MAMFAVTAAMAGMQLFQGLQESKESKYNASLYEKQAEAIGVQQGLEAWQYDRAKKQLAGTTIARSAKSGMGFGGSPLAVLIDNMTQIEMDKSIGQYNYEVEKRFSLSTADAYKRQAKMQKVNAYTNSFMSLLQGAYDYNKRTGSFNNRDPKGKTKTPYKNSFYPGGYSSMGGY